MKKGIMVAGSILVDKINTINAYPKSGELTQITSLSRSVGGCVPNVAIDLKKIDKNLGVYASGKIGKDDEAKFVLDTFNKVGVDTDAIVRSNERTSFTDVMSIQGGERTFFTYSGASAEYSFDDVDFTDLPEMLHLGYFLLLKKIDEGDGEKILKKATEQGIKTSIDLVSEKSDRYKIVIPCLKYVDNLIINEVEAGNITGIEPTDDNLERIMKTLKDMGIRERVIIHMPKKGLMLSNGGLTEVNSFLLPDGYVKGSTGAGDAFCAGSLYGIYRGYDDREILEFSSMVAAVSLRTADATSGIESEKAIREFCKDFKRR